MTIGQKIKKLRSELGMSADELAASINKNRATIYRYEREDIEMPYSVIEPLAKALKTTPDYLLGLEALKPKSAVKTDAKIKNLFPFEEPIQLPVYGEIRAGTPIHTDQSLNEFGEWDFADKSFGDGEHFFLRVSGNSMAPTIPEGSLVIIRKQNYAEKGEIVAACLDESYATLKRLFIEKDGSLLLKADNPEAESYVVTPEMLANGEARILGVVREIKIKPSQLRVPLNVGNKIVAVSKGGDVSQYDLSEAEMQAIITLLDSMRKN